jgi:hypothetical protein
MFLFIQNEPLPIAAVCKPVNLQPMRVPQDTEQGKKQIRSKTVKANHFGKSLVTMTLLGVLAISANAQSHRNIGARLNDQEARIQQGLKSGQLTPSEAQRLRARDIRIWMEAGRARISGGRMTTAERARLEAKLDEVNYSIAQQKLDRQRLHDNDSIGRELFDQEARIRAGLASGQLTRFEAERLRQKGLRVRFEAGKARITGGRMTAAERSRLEAILNIIDRDIYRERHDRQKRS